MRDLERHQRKLLAAAERAQATHGHERLTTRRPETDSVERLFCPTCLSVLSDDRCLRCQAGRPSLAFCRRCLDVALPRHPCSPWTLATGDDPLRPQTWRA
jgi:hypothetical protein